VWGVASITGPLVGGYITDALSWRWVFYLNVPFSLVCMSVIALAYPPSRGAKHVRVDWLGATLLFVGVSTLLLALGNDTGPTTVWTVLTVVLLAWFVLVERRAAEPILPIDLLQHPVMARTLGVVFLVGFALFGAVAFIPLFVQVVMAGSATQAGQVLTPLFLGWVIMSVISARATVRLGYRVVAITGGVLMTVGFGGLLLLGPDSARSVLLASCFVTGAGMGLQMLSLLLAVQHGIDRSRLGIATSLNQFSRSVGAAVGVSAMGALLARGVADVALPGGRDGIAASGALLLSGAARVQFAGALHNVFVAGAAASLLGLIATLFLPPVDFVHGVQSAAGERLIAAEMTNLEPEDEPITVAE
jgi:MFS family permease